jgi:hypothetical protein
MDLVVEFLYFSNFHISRLDELDDVKKPEATASSPSSVLSFSSEGGIAGNTLDH